MKEKFPIGFWNYVPCGKIDSAGSVHDWCELGMTIAMTCDYLVPADKDYILRNLNEAAACGLKMIVCDVRTGWKSLAEKGETRFREEVRQAVEDFGSHPAFYAFHVGDEPDKDSWQHMLTAVKIVRESSVPFVNYFPYFEEDFFERVGVDHNGYTQKLAQAVRETGLPMLSYDCYTQCFVHDREKGVDNYFYNLNRFRSVAQACGVPFWTTLLSVGHWAFAVPDEDMLRWQISTAVAHGVKGILWFYVYGRFLESSYRQSPFDQYYRRTPMFESLARQNKLFRDYYADKLAGAELQNVWHAGKAYGGTELYREGSIDGFSLRQQYGSPLIVSEFSDENGSFLVIVCNAQSDIEHITGTYKNQSFDRWLAPGQLQILMP